MLGYGDMTVESAAQGSLQVFRNVPDPVTVQKTIYDAREDRTMHLSGATGRSGGDAGSSRGRYDDLADLAKLRDDGVISDAEFEAEKAKLLGYDSHADRILERRMAKNPEAARKMRDSKGTDASESWPRRR